MVLNKLEEVLDIGDRAAQKIKPIKDLWNAVCLQCRPLNTASKDYLQFMAAREDLRIEEYKKKHGIEIEPIEVSSTKPSWLAMGFVYNEFSKKAKDYDAIVEFNEGHGKKVLGGFVREFKINAIGIRINDKTIDEKAETSAIGESMPELNLPHETGLHDYLFRLSEDTGLSIGKLIRKYDMTLHYMRADTITPVGLDEPLAEKRFRELSGNFDAVVDKREYKGEKALWGLLTEHIITATGITFSNFHKE